MKKAFTILSITLLSFSAQNILAEDAVKSATSATKSEVKSVTKNINSSAKDVKDKAQGAVDGATDKLKDVNLVDATSNAVETVKNMNKDEVLKTGKDKAVELAGSATNEAKTAISEKANKVKDKTVKKAGEEAKKQLGNLTKGIFGSKK